jgi:hypothetical protein
MSEAEIIHDAEVIGTELEPVTSGTLFRTEDPVEIIRRATETADALARVIKDKQLFKQIGNRNHVLVEGWTLLGTMLGVFPVVEWTRQIDGGGWEARVEARTLGGQVVGAAEAQCSRAEKEWGPTPSKGRMRDDYALRSMAQTRATSKALRGPLGFVVTLAGYEATPAEEMPAEGFSAPADRQADPPGAVRVPTSWAKLTELISVWDEPTHDMFMAFSLASARYLFGPEVDTKKLAASDKKLLLQKAAGAAVILRELFDPNTLPYPDIDAVRLAFAQVMDGVELAIPDEPGNDKTPQGTQEGA